MAFKMNGFSGLRQKEKPSVGSVVGDIDNRVSDALYDGDLLELGASLAQVSKDIETVKKAGKGKELEDYINPETYKDVNAFLNSSPFDKKDFSRGKLIEEMSKDTKLQGRWKGMTLSEFDKTLAKERDSYINSEPKPTAEEIKAFDKRHAENRRKAQGL